MVELALLNPAPPPWRERMAPAPYAERLEETPLPTDRILYMLRARLAASLPRAGIGELQRMATAVESLAPEMARLGDQGLVELADELRLPLCRQGFTPDLVAKVFALVREVSTRKLGLRHHPAQLMGGWAMLRGALAEMETGEGKTITALLPAVAAALAGQPVHVVTVNDYLAERDARQLEPVFNALRLSVGLVMERQDPEERRAAYAADVTYCTNKDLVFDYLRDHMALGRRRESARLAIDRWLGEAPPPLLLRGLAFAIVDEADSVLIDEARTPLILSAGSDEAGHETRYRRALELAGALVAGRDYEMTAHGAGLRLTEQGKTRLGRAVQSFRDDPFWRARRSREELVAQGLTALHQFHRDKHYIVADGKVQIVDENTGRVMADRTWERGLHQLIELKEGCEPSGQRRTEARITYQRFFCRYLHLCGMTGTAREAVGELSAEFALKVQRIPTHNPLRRRDLGIRLCATRGDKWRAVAERAIAVSREGRAVLVGTRSVGASEELSGVLSAAGLPGHSVLNARQDSHEAEIVARAGAAGCVTVATNMAGRGTDIRLPREVIERGGLHVILTEYHDSARVDRQLFGRSARQGNPGSFEAIVALDDELFERRVPALLLRRAAVAIGTRWASRVGRVLRWWAQFAAESAHARVRRATSTQDRRLSRALAFAGRAE